MAAWGYSASIEQRSQPGRHLMNYSGSGRGNIRNGLWLNSLHFMRQVSWLAPTLTMRITLDQKGRVHPELHPELVEGLVEGWGVGSYPLFFSNCN